MLQRPDCEKVYLITSSPTNVKNKIKTSLLQYSNHKTLDLKKLL